MAETRADLASGLAGVRQNRAAARDFRDLLQRIDAADSVPRDRPEDLSDALRALGIMGNRYRDAGSRSARADPSHNLVLFDDKPIEVLRRYARGGLT